MRPIAIFYHSLFYMGDPPAIWQRAVDVVDVQMAQLKASGLADAASEIVVGINGGNESRDVASLIVPSKARLVMHGLQSHNENLTLVELEKWLPGHPDWYVLYFHAKGSTSDPSVLSMRTVWRECMMRNLVERWRRCVQDLDSGFESVGCHWMTPPATPHAQFIWAGNFWWARSNFLRTLPSITQRTRIQQSGIGHIDSRYESEVWIGNGPRRPIVKDYHGPSWDPSKTATCAYT
jgi:hypothetical protein